MGVRVRIVLFCGRIISAPTVGRRGRRPYTFFLLPLSYFTNTIAVITASITDGTGDGALCARTVTAAEIVSPAIKMAALACILRS